MLAEALEWFYSCLAKSYSVTLANISDISALTPALLWVNLHGAVATCTPELAIHKYMFILELSKFVMV